VIHFLSEPFLTDEDYCRLGKEDYATDDYVVTSFALNSSMLVIGPYIPEENHKNDRMYYRIVAAVTYRSTPEGSYINYIRSVATNDERILSSPWDISLLLSEESVHFPKSEKEKWINSRRIGVMLMCTIQALCRKENVCTDIYLQTEYLNQSFLWFIMIGFWYSRQHYASNHRKKGFPLCMDAQKELPPSLAEFAQIGDVSYITSKSNESMAIQLLIMKSFLADLFAPVCKFSYHGMSQKWLFSVPFPAPVNYMVWKKMIVITAL